MRRAQRPTARRVRGDLPDGLPRGVQPRGELRGGRRPGVFLRGEKEGQAAATSVLVPCGLVLSVESSLNSSLEECSWNRVFCIVCVCIPV